VFALAWTIRDVCARLAPELPNVDPEDLRKLAPFADEIGGWVSPTTEVTVLLAEFG
jgi:hypothetical protein